MTLPFLTITDETIYKESIADGQVLRYGENTSKGFSLVILMPCLKKFMERIINNLLDVDAAVNLINEFKMMAPLCHFKTQQRLRFGYQNFIYDACGFSVRSNICFGGVLISNTTIDVTTAAEINKLFCEVVIAPNYDEEAIVILQEKKNRIILVQNEVAPPKNKFVRA
jgi:phosphoribosylaminoimidazolecarboxamide formyltransferase/IMP cyclohydrolase